MRREPGAVLSARLLPTLYPTRASPAVLSPARSVSVEVPSRPMMDHGWGPLQVVPS